MWRSAASSRARKPLRQFALCCDFGSILVTKLAEVKAISLSVGVYICGSASAITPISAVQYKVWNGASFNVSGVARSPWSHTTPTTTLLPGERRRRFAGLDQMLDD